MYGPTWSFLLIYGSHDMRHTGFRRLTVVNGTPENGASHIIHHMKQFINRTLCQVPLIIISKAYNLHQLMLIYATLIYQHIYNTCNMLLNFQQ